MNCGGKGERDLKQFPARKKRFESDLLLQDSFFAAKLLYAAKKRNDCAGLARDRQATS
jgi:hypothetical protein